MALDAAIEEATVFVMTRGEAQAQDYSWSAFKDGRVYYHCVPPRIEGPLADVLRSYDEFFAAVIGTRSTSLLVLNRARSQRRRDFMGRAIWATFIVVTVGERLPSLLAFAGGLSQTEASRLADRVILDGPDGGYAILPDSWDREVVAVLATSTPDERPLDGEGVFLLRGSTSESAGWFLPPRALYELKELLRETDRGE